MADFINTVDVIGDDALTDSIIDRTVTEFKDNSVTMIGARAFSGCAALTIVDCPNVVKLTGPTASDTMAYTFQGCVALTEVNLPEVTWAGNKMFISLPNLISINLPKLKSISGDQFIEDTGITKLLLTGLDGSVYNNSLRGNLQLRLVDLGKCTSIGNNALSGCSALSAMILRNTIVVTLGNVNAVAGTQIASGSGYIYVPKTLDDGRDGIAAYEAASNWSTFAGRFRYIEDYTVDGTLMGEIDESKISV